MVADNLDHALLDCETGIVQKDERREPAAGARGTKEGQGWWIGASRAGDGATKLQTKFFFFRSRPTTPPHMEQRHGVRRFCVPSWRNMRYAMRMRDAMRKESDVCPPPLFPHAARLAAGGGDVE